jgi:hypothetical protein
LSLSPFAIKGDATGFLNCFLRPLQAAIGDRVTDKCILVWSEMYFHAFKVSCARLAVNSACSAWKEMTGTQIEAEPGQAMMEIMVARFRKREVVGRQHGGHAYQDHGQR